MTETEKVELASRAREIRSRTIDMIGYLGVGHIGGALSVADLLALLYFRRMAVNPADPRWAKRDRLILSKGHAGPALYAALSIKGFFSEDWLHTLNVGGTRLPSHCDRNRTPGIDMTTGSLGQGLSAACGIALANRLNGVDSSVFVILGDGESDEGQVWEAAMFAAHNRLANIVAFTDYNKLQIDGATADILDLGKVEDKWASFGWAASRVNGHDLEAMDAEIAAALERRAAGDGRPTMIVLDTVKGKGASFCEGQLGSHNMTFDYETAKAAIGALDAGEGR